MIIETLAIENFRSVRSVTLECRDLTVILGRNGCGKSTLLKALEVFYNVGYQATEYDYFDKDVSADISIRVTYGDLRPSESAEFAPYIAASRLAVVKKINSGGARYYGIAGQIPQFVEIRKLGALAKRSRLNQLIDVKALPGLSGRATSAVEAEEIMDAYEANHPELATPTEREQQFFGARSVGGGKLDKYTKFVLIPAVRDASSEIDRKGIINQLIDVLVARSVDARPDVQQLNADFEARVRAVYSRDNLGELRALADTITTILRRYAPNAALDLAFGDVTPPKIQLPAALASLIEDDFSSPIGYSGHGVQRALILALLQQLSTTDTALPPDLAQAPTDAKPQPAPVPAERPADLILAIEEPELYLHPGRARFLSSVLTNLATRVKEPSEPRTQVLYCTHSPYFVDLADFDWVRMARKVPRNPGAPMECVLTSYSLEQAASRLAVISRKDQAVFTPQSFVAHAGPIMTSMVNEGFFADVVVVVEGTGDVGILWALQYEMGKRWDEIQITVVPALGKSSIDRPVVIFSGLGVPTYFVFDGDAHLQDEAKRNAAARTNQLLQRLVGVDPGPPFPETQVNANWAVLQCDVETEIRQAVGTDAYNQICRKVADDLGLPDPARMLKNSHASTAFVQRAYREGHRIPVLESIVERITALHA